MPDNETGVSSGRRDSRDASPPRSPTPNSVKAFAEARQHGRKHSISESRRLEKTNSKRRTGGTQAGFVPKRTLGSVRSFNSRSSSAGRHSATPTSDGSKEDNENLEDRLSIDYDCLEALVNAPRREKSAPHAFPSLVPEDVTPSPVPMVTADGDFVDLPQWPSVEPKKEGKAQDLDDALKCTDPNRFSFFSSARESSIHAPEFRDLLLPGENVRQLFSFPKGTTGGVWWLHMNHPTKEEVRSVCDAFNIHPLTLEDITTQESREKIELFRSYYFASFRSFITVVEPDGVDFAAFSMYLVVFREGAITFSYAPEKHASRVRLRIDRLNEHVSLSSDWICYALIDDIVDSFLPAIKQIEREADEIDDEVLITRPNDHQEFLRRMGRVRTDLMGLMRLLNGKPDVLRAFAKRCNEDYFVTPRMDIGLYLGDIQDHVVTMINDLIQSERILSRCHSSYLAHLSINNIDQGNRTIKFLGRVAVIASVLVPLNVICLLFGMNVKVPWGWEDYDDINAWLGIMSFIVIVAFIALLVAKRLRYI